MPTDGSVCADAELLAELEAAGYSRTLTLEGLAKGDASYLTASYFLLAEAKAEATRKACPKVVFSSSSSSSRAGASRPSASRAPAQVQAPASAAAAAAVTVA